MKRTISGKLVSFLLAVSLLLFACSGCGGENCNNDRLKLHPIYESALLGALIGGIIGHQSDEDGEGAALGAAVFGIGTLLEQTDKMPDNHRVKKEKEQDDQEVVIQIQNDNGSYTPVVLKKKGGTYMGPNGEHYKHLPTAEQLKPVYGL